VSAPPAAPKRRMMADRLTIGQRWRRRRDHRVFEIKQVWRPDRQAHLMALEPLGQDEDSIVVSFAELRRKWSQVR
jgi:hypothetical protein